MVLSELSVLAATDVAQRVCSPDAPEEAGPICTYLYDSFGVQWLALLGGNLVPTLVQIVFVFAIAFIANRLVRRLIKRSMHGLQEKALAKLGGAAHRGPLASTRPIDIARSQMRTETIAGVLRSLATVVIWGLAVITALGAFDINLGPLIAGAGIAGVAIGFGAQSLVRDFLSGIFMLLEDQYGIGDYIDVGDAKGTVEAISLRVTRLRDIHGVVWHVPNGEIRRVGNMSQQWARSLLDIEVAYETNIATAIRVIERTARGLAEDRDWSRIILEDPEVWGVQDLGDNGVTIRLVIKVQPLKQWKVERELRQRIKAAFDEAGIEIPFPQRTTWLRVDSDNGGGTTALHEMLEQRSD